jgi:hypothetical protein
MAMPDIDGSWKRRETTEIHFLTAVTGKLQLQCRYMKGVDINTRSGEYWIRLLEQWRLENSYTIRILFKHHNKRETKNIRGYDGKVFNIIIFILKTWKV